MNILEILKWTACIVGAVGYALSGAGSELAVYFFIVSTIAWFGYRKYHEVSTNDRITNYRSSSDLRRYTKQRNSKYYDRNDVMQAIIFVILIILTLKSDHGKWFWGLLIILISGWNLYNA